MEDQNRAAKVLLLLVGFVLVLCLGMAIGGAVVYGVMRLSDALPWGNARSVVLDFGDQPEELPLQRFEPGVVIVEVVPGSPAERAGLQEGDRILAVDGQGVSLGEDLGRLIARYEPGDRVTLEIRRSGGEAEKVLVKLGDHPERTGTAYLGVTYSSSPWYGIPRGEDEFGLDELPFVLPPGGASQGVIIMSVDQDSPAADAGLRQGDVITALDGEPLASPRSLVDAIAAREPGDRITLSIFRLGGMQERDLEIRLAEHPDLEGEAYLGVRVGGRFRYLHPQGPQGGELPPGLDLPGLRLRLDVPFGELLLDELPFDLRDLPFDWEELEQELERYGVPAEGDSL